MKEKDYNFLLLDYLSKLSSYDRASGGEGIVYFVNDEFIIKKYSAVSYWKKFDEVFDEFCKEMQSLSEVTNYPKIYAWQCIPNVKYYLGKEENKNDYYILEERVRGRDLYKGFLQDCYDIANIDCSKKQFYDIVDFPEDYYSLFCRVVNAYISDYIEINEMLEGMNERDIEKLISDFYYVDSKTQFLISDIQSSNIILDSEKLRPIDPMVLYMNDKKHSKREIVDSFIMRMVNLFWANELCTNKSIENYFKYDKAMLGDDFKNLQCKNMKICKAAMLKFAKVMNSYLGQTKITNELYKNITRETLQSIFYGNEKYVEEIERQLNM